MALGWIALHRALDPLPEAARRAAFERERPVLAVFAGTSDLPEDLLAEPRGPAARDAAPVLDALAAELPEIEAYADGVLATYGSPAPFAPSYPHRALAHLLLRAGGLRTTRTPRGPPPASARRERRAPGGRVGHRSWLGPLPRPGDAVPLRGAMTRRGHATLAGRPARREGA